MNDKTLKRIEAKLDIIIGLLQDGILTGDETVLLMEADEIIRRKHYSELSML
jgi:hypothetical protein